MYFVRQVPENTDRVVSGLILTKVLLRNFEFEIELYLVRHTPKDTKYYTWIGTDLNVFVGVDYIFNLLSHKQKVHVRLFSCRFSIPQFYRSHSISVEGAMTTDSEITSILSLVLLKLLKLDFSPLIEQ